VNSPIAAACFSCHDNASDIAHMRGNGGSLYAARTTALATAEQCTICHLAGKVAGIAAMHGQ
jgi:D-tyrosyl-tRNA(Tyr) deacylase